jgi:hypothetical protein
MDYQNLKNPCQDESAEKYCCNLFENITVGEHFQMLLEIMEHSYIRDFENDEEKMAFFNNVVLKGLKNQNLSFTNPQTSILNTILFANLTTDFQNAKSQNTKMNTVITGRGICYSYNSLPMHQIYQPSHYQEMWNLTFGAGSDEELEYPTVWGPAQPLYIVAQSFEPSSVRTSHGFMLSFTNEFNSYDVIQNSFEILPGYQHTFRVIPSQLSTTVRFDELKLGDRKCKLKNENEGMRLLSRFSKSGCEFECALEKSSDTCSCMPWSVARRDNNSKTCDMFGNLCFKNAFNSPQTYEGCGCMNDCQATTYIISESSKPISNWKELCLSSNVISQLANYVHENYNLYFTLSYFIDKQGPDPDSLNNVCEFLIKNHVSVIKVEIGAKSVIKSVRDVKTTFENQLSAVGRIF